MASKKKERIRALLAGQEVDRAPVSLWGHDFLREWSAEDLAAHTLEAYRAHDWDFIKLNPRWTFFAEAWGNTYEPPDTQRFPKLTSRAVEFTADLAHIEPVDPRAGVFAEHLEAIRLITGEVGDEVDVVATLFSPLAVLGLVCGGVGEPLISYANEDPALAHHAIAAINETLTGYALAALEAGAAGLFFAPLQWTSRDQCSDDFYREYGRPYDLQLLHSVRGADFNILHVCGDNNRIDMMLDYPVPAVNWADQSKGNPSLAEVRRQTDKVVLGGIDHAHLGDLATEEIDAQVQVALRDGATRTMVTGGCGISPLVGGEARDEVVRMARAVSSAG